MSPLARKKSVTRKSSIRKPATRQRVARVVKPDYLSLLPGALLPGGVFAGIVYDRGKPEVLIVGPEFQGEGDWDTVTAWAKGLNVEGCTDFFIPLRSHGRILQANISQLFQPSLYWLGEQHASHSDYAWTQDFDHGTQYYWTKGRKRRARAVRRLAI